MLQKWLRGFSIACLCLILNFVGVSGVAQAAKVDPYVLRYLRVTEPIPLKTDIQGQTRLFSAPEISQGKQLFEENCKTCHVAGSTLPNPTVSLSLQDLQAATPPRDSIAELVNFFRHPLTYDSSEDALLCREVPETWLSQPEAEKMAAFILRAAEVAPGWGTSDF